MAADQQNRPLRSANHWGVGEVVVKDGVLRNVSDPSIDPNPSQLNRNIASSVNGRARVLRPAIRKGWLEKGPMPACGARGKDVFVEVPWDEALDLVADAFKTTRNTYGNESIFAGSYGWASAGRFHHAQSQLKRFLNAHGGFVRSKGNYSYNAALTLMPHIVADYRDHVIQTTRFSSIAAHGELVVMFGGIPLRNTQVSDGGIGVHRVPSALADCVRAGVRFVNFSPLRTDADASLNAEWHALRPGSDTAIMLGLAHVLLTEGLHDLSFLRRYCVGYDEVAAYIRGETDGVEKNVAWASAQSGIPAQTLRDLALEMQRKRTMICTAASLQRADYGEQPLWMTVTLAAMIGQIGLPGGGYTIGYGVNGVIGAMNLPVRSGSFPQGINPVSDFIPVAMTSEMLLRPDEQYEFNGETRKLPNVKMVWWAGGNPFHHHQDLNRLRRAFQMPETIIVNEINWTATARHADIVLPVASPEERRDFVAGQQDNMLIPSPALVDPIGEAKTEYDVYCALEARLGEGKKFSRGRLQEQWLERMWKQTQSRAATNGGGLPDWQEFMSGDPIELVDPAPDRVFLAAFRDDPIANPLPTPSGRIELVSEVIGSFGYQDCPRHATWFPPRNAAGLYPLALVSGQPATRLHSQMDNGDYSMSHKIKGREPVLVHPSDAEARGISDGEIVELWNDKGRCLAGARVTPDIGQGTVFLWTGAWYDPDFTHREDLDRHGNPNVLTHDLRTSQLSQGPAAHSSRVDLRRFDGGAPKVMAHEPPEFVEHPKGKP